MCPHDCIAGVNCNNPKHFNDCFNANEEDKNCEKDNCNDDHRKMKNVMKEFQRKRHLDDLEGTQEDAMNDINTAMNC